MRRLIFTFVIVLILEQHRSFQGQDVSVENPDRNARMDARPIPAEEEKDDSFESFEGDFSNELPISTSIEQYNAKNVSQDDKSFMGQKKNIVASHNWLHMKEEKRRAKAVSLFKNNVVELIDATVRPLCNNKVITKQALSCSRIIKNTRAFASISLIIQTMIIVRNHSSWLPKISGADNGVAAARMIRHSDAKIVDNIEKIVDVCLLAQDDFVLHSLESVLIEHLENLKPDPSYVSNWTSWLDYDVQSATDCYQLMVGIDCNKEFFEKLLQGFTIVSQKMKREAKAATITVEKNEQEIVDEEQRLKDIENEIKDLKLIVPEKSYRKEEIDTFCSLLDAQNRVQYDQKIDAVKTKVMWIGLIFLAIYTAKGAAWLYKS